MNIAQSTVDANPKHGAIEISLLSEFLVDSYFIDFIDNTTHIFSAFYLRAIALHSKSIRHKGVAKHAIIMIFAGVQAGAVAPVSVSGPEYCISEGLMHLKVFRSSHL